MYHSLQTFRDILKARNKEDHIEAPDKALNSVSKTDKLNRLESCEYACA